jgi:hypothetical protein
MTGSEQYFRKFLILKPPRHLTNNYTVKKTGEPGWSGPVLLFYVVSLASNGRFPGHSL